MSKAGSFGGKQVDIIKEGYRHNGFRAKVSGNRCVICRSPQYVYDRIAAILTHSDGLQAYQGDISRLGTNTPVNANKVYIDPPYANTTKYAHSFDLTALVNRLTAQGVTCYVSESKPLSENAHLIGERSNSKLYAKGQPTKRQEWLTVYPPC